MAINVTVWNEFRHEKKSEKIAEIYPKGIHGCIADFLASQENLNVRTATLDEPEHGLTQEVLDSTDVLIWWGHTAHNEVSDEIVQRVYQRVQDGMGFIPLHSAHASKVFVKLCGTNSNDLRWREANEKEIIWCLKPSHPIADGIDANIILEHEEMYGEPFLIPTPDDLIFMSWFAGGDIFKSGFTYYRGKGKIFYFRPGHEGFPTFYNAQIQKVITNAVNWAAPTTIPNVVLNNVPPIVPIEGYEH